MPMQTSRCPQCGASVGGSDHQASIVISVCHKLESRQIYCAISDANLCFTIMPSVCTGWYS